MQRERRTRGDGGAAAVEFALLLPFLAILVCGTIDLGRWYSAWNEVKNAAREGAAYGQTHPNSQRPAVDCPSPDNIADRASQELAGNQEDDSFTVTVEPVAACGSTEIQPGDTITVTVQRKVTLITPLIRNIVGDVAITADAEVKVLG